MILKKLPGAFQGIVAKVEFCQDRVFIKYCVFSKIFKYILDSGLSRFSLGVSVCTQYGRANISATAELAEFRKTTTF